MYLLAGGILIVIFSTPFISSVVEIATYWSLTPMLLAFFLAPVASEMPEILESISLSRKGNMQNINIAFSNMVGGTITKTTLLCSVSSLIIHLNSILEINLFSFRFYVFMVLLGSLLGKVQVILFLYFF